jgi:hypothetical protein
MIQVFELVLTIVETQVRQFFEVSWQVRQLGSQVMHVLAAVSTSPTAQVRQLIEDVAQV